MRAMFMVKFSLPLAEVGPLMGAMRVWLDKRRIVPTAFHCRDTGGRVEVEVGFERRDDATACAAEFEGVSLAAA